MAQATIVSTIDDNSSGDKQAIVTNFAEKLGITQAYGDLLPDGKVKHIEALRSNPANRIAFVGDGINDAPVLALSHVGIAMGGLGSDAAIETADVVIQTDQPSRVAGLLRSASMCFTFPSGSRSPYAWVMPSFSAPSEQNMPVICCYQTH